MAIPTKAELNGRTLYTVINTATMDGALYTLYVGTDETEATRRAGETHGAVVLACLIHHDTREDDEE